jgi:peptidoglycan/xylan/chitin deacetylase (PgdA/CDA1 family)
MEFSICLTHDVDRVRKTYQYLTHDLRKGRIRNLRQLWSKVDPYWNFGRIRALEDRFGVRSTWFFLEESIPFELLRPSRWKLSLGRYSVRERSVAREMRALDRDGWEVGLHGSYRSYQNLDLLKLEKEAIEGALGKPVDGVRQHYLNLEVPGTWRLHRAAGLLYDASFGYRRGLGWRQDRLNVFKDAASGMVVLPLAVMESNLFSEAGGDMERAWQVALDLIDQAEARGALFTVLWHPHVFSDADFPGYGMIYERIIREGCRRGAKFLTCGEAVRAFKRRQAEVEAGTAERTRTQEFSRADSHP